MNLLLRRYSTLLLAVVLFGMATLLYWHFVVDDAYISFVYALNWAQGNGLTYNGLIVEGYSNFFWTVLMAGAIKLGLDPLAAARGLSLMSGAICLFVLDKLNSRLNPDLGPGGRLLAMLSIGLTASFLAWTVGGLETVFFAALIAASLYAEIRGGWSANYASPVLALGVALTRPEGVMLFPILLASRWLQHRRLDTAWLVSCLLFSLPYGLFIFWRYSTYGYPVPNTAYLKLGPSLETISLAADYLLSFLLLRPLFSGLLLAGLIVLARRRALFDPAWLLCSIVVLAFAGFVLVAGSDWMPYHRFLVPILPILGLFIGKALGAPKDKWLRLALHGLTLTSIVLEIALSLSLYRPLTLEFGRYTDGLIQAGDRIREITAPDDRIAVVDAGAIVYYSRRPTIDILGLNDEHIAHTPGKSDPAYVLAQKPQIIQLHAAFSATGELVKPIEQRAAREMIEHPGFKECYAPDSQRPPDPYYPYLFFRHCP